MLEMVDQIPARAWLLLAIAIAAYAPARALYTRTPAPGAGWGGMRPIDGPGWRRPRPFSYNLAIVAALAALAVFIFTPTAEQFAHSPSFWPILMAAAGAWSLFTVARGSATGQIQPIVRGFYNTYARGMQPKRFWASMAWNATFGFLCFWIAFKANEQGVVQPLKNQCYDYGDAYSPQVELAACNQLIDGPSKTADDRPGLMEARGTAYYRLGDYRHALDDDNSSIRLEPNESSSHFNRALANQQFGYIQPAITDYTAAIRLKSDNADAYLNRGLIFLDTNKLDQALDDFTHVLGFRPKDAVALANRGITYAWKGDTVRAQQDFAIVRAADPSSPVLLRGEALLSMNTGDIDAAVKYLSAALKVDPNDRWSLSMRAKVYRELGDPAKSQADIERLQRLGLRGSR